MMARAGVNCWRRVAVLAATLLAVAGPAADSVAATPVTTAGTRFMQDGVEVVVTGINYFPAYFPAIFPRSWLDPRYYRADVVDGELAAIHRLGFNLVSVSAAPQGATVDAAFCGNLNDFLARAQHHGLLVNLYVGTGSRVPIADPLAIANVPKICALAGNPTVFAYDIAWEANFGTYADRMALDPAWRRWLQAQYLSLAGADAAFGGGHALPTDLELCNPAPSVRVAAFRRFLDDTLAGSYRDVRAALLAADPSHLIGARSGNGGNGARLECPRAPVDLRAGAKYLDFVSPEAYALSQVDTAALTARGDFTAAYADVGKPVFWAEFGINADGSCPNCTEAVQQRFDGDVLAMIGAGAGNGGAAWWFVGSRPQSPNDKEHSDDGIVYDYQRYPTGVDAAGLALRNGWLSLCTRSPGSVALYVTPAGAQAGACPAGMTAAGSFPVGGGAAAAVARGIDGRSIPAGLVTLCSRAGAATLAGPVAGPPVGAIPCPAGTQAAGLFRTDGNPPSGQFAKLDQWQLCAAGGAAFLERTWDDLSGQGNACPAGSSAAGEFKPAALPVFRGAASVFRNALAGASAGQRQYAAWISVDRDAAAADWKMYEQGTAAIAAAGAGVRVGVQTACHGSDSRSVRQCVGNGPYYAGCPAKCLDATWNSVRIKNAAGSWQAVRDGDTVRVAANGPVLARLSAANTGEATWLSVASAGGLAGAVRFGCRDGVGDIACRADIAADQPMFGDAVSGDVVVSAGIGAPATLVLQMVSEYVGWFGEQVVVHLLPQ